MNLNTITLFRYFLRFLNVNVAENMEAFLSALINGNFKKAE